MSLDRRSFLLRSAATLGAGAVAGVGAQQALADGSSTTTTGPGGPASNAPSPETAALTNRIPFDGPHQAGILELPRDQVTFAALDAVATDRQTLIEGLQALTARARQLTQGTTIPNQEVDEPPADSGILGTTIAPDALTVTVGFGASLFDDRYGLAKSRPAGLVAMPNFPNDEIDVTRAHGDLLLTISAQRRDTVVHTLRELMRPIRDRFSLRWTLDGFQSSDRGPTPHSSRRNLFAFRDGTANPKADDAALMNQLVWLQPGDDPAAWTAGGTYQVMRTIRMHVEFWDRVGLREQENMIGRYRDSGAPLGGSGEFQAPDYGNDPRGVRIPLDAHIRLARPRTAETEDQRILRRSWNYSRGFDIDGQLDQGLAFVGYNRDVDAQFAKIQKRLSNEPMVDYIKPVGGGYYFVPPGTKGLADWVGSGLFSA